MKFKKIIKLFEKGNVCVTGLRGDGKDMLISNVVIRRRMPYVSNVDYGGGWSPFIPTELDCGKNIYRNFISGDVRYYQYPHPDGTDIYVSDAGIYFPSQYCNELNRDYPYIATFQAISRHVGKCNFHINVQSLNRCYDKIREQSEIFILCRGCWVIGGIVIQRIRIYDQYDSCVHKVRPFSVPTPILANAQTRYAVKLQKATYEANHGYIKNAILIYRNKSNYDTRFFKRMLENGRKEGECLEKTKVA